MSPQEIFSIGFDPSGAPRSGGSVSWTERHAFEGTLILGGTGSGKTSGSGETISRKLLKLDYGGLVLCVKPEERIRWQKLMKDAGRSDDLIVFSPEENTCLNVLEYELQSNPNCFTSDLVTLLMTALEGGRKQESKDRFWDDTMAQTLTNAIDLIRLSQPSAGLTVPLILDVIQSAPATFEEYQNMASEKFSDSAPLLIKLADAAIARADAGQLTEPQKKDLKQSIQYFRHWTLLDPRTQSSIRAVISSRLASLARAPFRELFSAPASNVSPDLCRDRKVIVLDLPVKVYGQAGKLAQVLFKTIWQRAMERQQSEDASPVFLWADEAQFFITEYDLFFQQTARSARVATVYLTQSIVNLRAALDEGNATHISDALTGNFQTKIFHANACTATNQYAELLFGEVSYYATTFGTQESSYSVSEQLRSRVPSRSFLSLRKGGHEHKKTVEAIVFSSVVDMTPMEQQNLDSMRAFFHQH